MKWKVGIESEEVQADAEMKIDEREGKKTREASAVDERNLLVRKDCSDTSPWHCIQLMSDTSVPPSTLFFSLVRFCDGRKSGISLVIFNLSPRASCGLAGVSVCE